MQICFLQFAPVLRVSGGVLRLFYPSCGGHTPSCDAGRTFLAAGRLRPLAGRPIMAAGRVISGAGRPIQPAGRVISGAGRTKNPQEGVKVVN